MKTRTLWIIHFFISRIMRKNTLLWVDLFFYLFLLFKIVPQHFSASSCLLSPRTYKQSLIQQLTAIIDHGCKCVFGLANVTVQCLVILGMFHSGAFLTVKGNQQRFESLYEATWDFRVWQMVGAFPDRKRVVTLTLHHNELITVACIPPRTNTMISFLVQGSCSCSRSCWIKSETGENSDRDLLVCMNGWWVVVSLLCSYVRGEE